MPDTPRCPSCGAEIAPGATPEGRCAKCLLKLGMPEDRDEVDTTRISSSGTPGTESVGPYRVLRKLGEGGMGEVYLAEQRRPIRRTVALKLIKAGMDTKQVVARFESERQALALMNHPNIAQVYDAGATDSGRPYFVMEYVQGIPVTQYCDRSRLSTRERLDLFTQVCAGVQHAHQKGVIHRDIKPSNVLIAVEDGKPVPKIIDFGVAKAAWQPLTDASLSTQAGVLLGTPAYMSPEQAEAMTADIDTRTDVYSLGVLLYELLSGALPFEPRELRRVAIDEICRRIREEEPSRPSTRIGTTSDPSTASAHSRRTDPPSLARQLRGDLDWITMKALEKDRNRRYGSPNELATDIRHHLQHEPVAAGPPSAAYRARKFIRRHRLGFAFGAVMALVLLTFAVSMAIQASRIARERDRANEEASTAEQVSEFLVGLFEVSDPGEARGNTITAREVLDAGAQEIERALADQPRVKARLLHTIGRVYDNLGLYEEAEPLLRRSLTKQRELLGESDPGTLTTARTLAWTYVLLGRYEESASLNLQSLGAARRGLGESHLLTLQIMNGLANVYRHLGRYEEAESLFLETLATQRRVLGEEHESTRSTMVNLASLYGHMGLYDKAEPLRVEELALTRRIDGEDHPWTLGSMGDLANLYSLLGRNDEAEPLFLQALEAKRRVLGDDHPRTQDTMNNLALLYVDVGRYAEAEELLDEILRVSRVKLGEEHPDTLITLQSLGTLYRHQERYDEAEQLLLGIIDARRRVSGEKHPWTLSAIHHLARIRAETGDTESALELLREAVEAGFDQWGQPARLLEIWGSFEDNPEYGSIVAGLKRQVDGEDTP